MNDEEKISTFNPQKEAKEARPATEKHFMSPVSAAQMAVMSKVRILPYYKRIPIGLSLVFGMEVC